MKKHQLKHYPHTMTMLNKDGDWLFTPVSCKEEFYHTIARHLSWRTKRKCFALNGRDTEGFIDTYKPTIVFYGNNDAKVRKFQKKRIEKILGLLSDRQDLWNATTKLLNDSNAILITVDPWYLKSPVGISGLLTFIREAATSNYEFASIKSLVDQAIKRDKEPSLNMDNNAYLQWEANQPLFEDPEHLADARRNGNLKGFLNKSLKCFKKPRYDSYRYCADHDGYYGEFILDGFADYDKSERNYSRFTMKDLLRDDYY